MFEVRLVPKHAMGVMAPRSVLWLSCRFVDVAITQGTMGTG
jgi:hypothetical protein